jgi:hypothetical protein
VADLGLPDRARRYNFHRHNGIARKGWQSAELKNARHLCVSRDDRLVPPHRNPVEVGRV